MFCFVRYNAFMNEIIRFVDGGLSLDVSVSPNRENVWLTAEQMASLFDRDITVIRRHVKSILSDGELTKDTSSAKNALHLSDGRRFIVTVYNLDMILAVGYRVKSSRGIVFRHWASGILKQYLIEGYAANEKRLSALGRVIDVQKGLISSLSEKAGLESEDVLSVLNAYEEASGILDDYDHGTLAKPIIQKTGEVSYLDEPEAFEIIKTSSFSSRADLFGRERAWPFKRHPRSNQTECVWPGDLSLSRRESCEPPLFRRQGPRVRRWEQTDCCYLVFGVPEKELFPKKARWLFENQQ